MTITGTLPEASLSPDSTSAEAGIYSATNLPSIENDLQASNLRSGTNIFGVVGTASENISAGANALAEHLLLGATAFVDGSLITGTLGETSFSANTPLLELEILLAPTYNRSTQIWYRRIYFREPISLVS